MRCQRGGGAKVLCYQGGFFEPSQRNRNQETNQNQTEGKKVLNGSSGVIGFYSSEHKTCEITTRPRLHRRLHTGYMLFIGGLLDPSVGGQQGGERRGRQESRQSTRGM